MEPATLVLLPSTLVVLRVQHLAVVQLLSLDRGEVLVDLQVPVLEDLGLREHSCCQVADAIVPNRRVRDHVVSKVLHLVCVLSEVLGQTSLMASRGQEVSRLASLGKHQKWLIVLLLGELETPSLLKVFTDANLGLSDLSGFVGLLPGEGHRLGCLVPEDLLDLVRCRVVGSDDNESRFVEIALARGLRLRVVPLRTEHVADLVV